MNSTDINSTDKRATCFGPFRYDWEQRLLFREGEMVPLAPKVAETLRVLLERHGTVMEKAELMRAVWPDTSVGRSGWRGTSRSCARRWATRARLDGTSRRFPSGDTGLWETW